MKSIIALLFVFVAQPSFAHNDDILIGHPVDAQIEVTYYRNLMPTIGPVVGERRVYTVEVTVEFCRTVSKDMFVLHSFEIPRGNVLQLYSREDAMIDCHGPTRAQTMKFRLPKSANKDLPFYSAEYAPALHVGDVH